MKLDIPAADIAWAKQLLTSDQCDRDERLRGRNPSAGRLVSERRTTEAYPIASVDGCKRGWLCLVQDATGSVMSACFDAANALFAQTPGPAVLPIDIPIGLPDAGPRACDREARTFIGPRRNSVFSAPIRPVLSARSWEEACSIRYRVEGKRMSKQAWEITHKIAEVDRALRADPLRHTWVREVHPEVSFRAWHGTPLAYAKKKPGGRAIRAELVAQRFGNDAFHDVRAKYRRSEVADDDILDAFAALWTAERIQRGRAGTLPAAVPTDSEGLRMEIVY